MKSIHPRNTRFGKLKVGANFLWGSIDPKYRKIDESTAVRLYSHHIGKTYAFADKCLVIKLKEQ